MLSKFRCILIVSYLITCIDIVYGYNIKRLEDLLDENISLEDRSNYLDSIKDNYPFSTEDFSILINVFYKNQDREAISKSRENNEILSKLDQAFKEESKNLSPEELRMKEKIITSILEIFLREDINNEVLVSDQISTITSHILAGIKSSFNLPFEIRYLSLKVLIKLNELKYNGHDDSSVKAIEATKIMSSNNPEYMKLLEDQEFLDKLKSDWLFRESVENAIFNPVLLKDDGLYNRDKQDKNNYYKTEDKKVLKDYERYLLEYIKYFPITDNVQQLVEQAFFNTQFVEFRPKYIEAMFALNMYETLVKIISDKSIDIELKTQAIDVSIKLLDHTDRLYFKRFSTSLLKSLQKMLVNLNEEDIKNKIQENIEYVKSKISTHDDIKDLEYIVFHPSISVGQKIEYLNSMVELGISFSKQDLKIITKIFDDEDLDIRVKSRVSTIMLYRGDIQDIGSELSEEDLDAMAFLYLLGYNVPGPEVKDITAIITNMQIQILLAHRISKAMALRQFGRFFMWKQLITFIDGTIEKDDFFKKTVIKSCLRILSRTKRFEDFSTSFLNAMHRISNDPKASNELKNVVDYILVKLKNGDLTLKDAYSDCALNMML